MVSQQSSVEIVQFTSTAENVTEDGNRDETSIWVDEVDGSERPATPVAVPEALRNLAKKGVEFQQVHFWGIHEEKPKLVRNQSIYFSVDTVITSQAIIEAFNQAGIDSGEIIAVQRKASNNSWVVTFDSPVTKEAALEVASVEIDGATVFLGDCEHRLVLVKMYESPEELPDTALIGRLTHYGRVLSFRRDLIAEGIHNGVRTARMELHRHIPSIINLAGEVVRVWYPNQPKTCRNCGSKDHLVKNCSSVRCLNCEQSGHRSDDCPEADMCDVCKGFGHSMADCPYVLFSANVAAKVKPSSESKSDGKEEKQCEKVDREALKAEREKRKAEHRKKQQQLQKQQKKSHEERSEKGRGQRGGDEKAQKSRDEPPRVLSRDERPREERPREERPRDDRRPHRMSDDEDRRRRDRNEERREREREERHRDRDYRRNYTRDRSSRRESRYSDSDDDDGDCRWTLVSSRRRRRYDDD